MWPVCWLRRRRSNLQSTTLMMRMIVGGPDSPGPAPKSARVVQIVIFAIMSCFILCGFVMESASTSARVAAGAGIVVLALFAILFVSRQPSQPIASRRKRASTDSYPMMDPFSTFPSSFDHTPPLAPDTSWQADTTPPTDISPSFDSTPSFDSGSSSFDSGSSSCGSSSND